MTFKSSTEVANKTTDYLVPPVYPPSLESMGSTEATQSTEFAGFDLIREEEATRRLAAEKALRESEVKYKNFFENAQVALYRTRLSDGKCYECNELFARILGFASKEECMRDYVSKDHYLNVSDRKKMIAVLKKNLAIENYEVPIRRKDGALIWVAFSAKINLEKKWIEGALVDITKQKKIEAELIEKEKTLRSLIDMPLDGIGVIDAQGIIYEVNALAAQRRQKKIPELIGQNLWDLYPYAISTLRKMHVLKVFKTGKPERYEDEYQGVWNDSNIYPIFDQAGKVFRVAIFNRDITKRKQFEKTLQESLAKNQALLKAMPDAYFVFDLAGNILDFFVHPQTAELQKRFLGKNMNQLKLGEKLTADLFSLIQKAYKKRKLQSTEFTLVENKESKYFEARLTRLAENRVLALVREVTRRRNLERKLSEIPGAIIRAQEEERTRISHEIHDDLGQSLAALKLLIQTNCQSANVSVPRETKELIVSSLDGVIHKTRNLAMGLRPTLVENKGLTHSIKDLVFEFRHHHRIRVHFRIPELSTVKFRGERINFYRIIQEALANIAKHAKASEVELAIRRQQKKLIAQIKDNGCGFSMGQYAKGIHDAKAPHMGIQTMKERTRILKGIFDIQSNRQQGTQIKVVIPLAT